MKEKVIIFIIGLLLGAVISTGSIYIYTIAANNSDSNNNQTMQMPSDQNGNGMPSGNTPPDLPSSNTATQSNS